MTKNNREIQRKLRVLSYAEQLGDVSGTRRNDQIDPMPGRWRGIPGIQRKGGRR